jgi:gamma-glutamyltranspeptidase/glutathione hydrolase
MKLRLSLFLPMLALACGLACSPSAPPSAEPAARGAVAPESAAATPAGATTRETAAPRPDGPVVDAITPPVVAPHAMVTSAQEYATHAGVEILKKGGNAVDAAVAVGFALQVVYPEAGNIGGGGFMVIRFTDGRVTTLDYREKAPLAARPDMYLDKQGNVIENLSWVGHLSAGVPGSVKGMLTALERYGRLDRKTVLEPAIRLAREGFPLSAGLIEDLEDQRDDLCRFAGTREAFFAGRPTREIRDAATGATYTTCVPQDSATVALAARPPVPDPNREKLPPNVGRREPFQPPAGIERNLGIHAAGDTLRQPDLARTLLEIAEGGADPFYKGRIADLIVAEMERGGGLITKADLAAYNVVEREPIHTSYRGYDVYSMPPSSSGGVILAEILNQLEVFDLHALVFHTAPAVHVAVEAMRRAYADRNTYLGDPAFVTMPLDTLLSKDYARALAASIDTARATPSDQIRAGMLFASVHESDQTTHYSIVDSTGMAVAVTTTLNNSFGSGVVVQGAGFLLNDEMDDFTVKPGVPNAYGLVQGKANAIEPGKRMLSAMTPTIVVKDGAVFLVVGTPGGSTIITTVAQVISNVIDFGMPLHWAVGAGRFHHQHLPDKIFLESGTLTVETIERLRQMGHDVSTRGGTSGRVNAILRDPRTHELQGVADPREYAGLAEGF